MEIDVIYSKADPKQRSMRDFVVRFIEERGILAQVFEHIEKVPFVELIIDGIMLKEKRHKPRQEDSVPYPTVDVVAEALEQHCWR